MKKNILVLDDCRFTLNVLGDMLSDLDYDVTIVDNGRDACQKINSTLYDLIITDMNMPDMDGIEFAKQVRACPGCRFIPIVLISGEKNEDIISRAKKMGVSTFLSKPLKTAQLKAILQITLNKRLSPRMLARLNVSYKANDMLSDFVASHTLDVSLGGAYIETNNPLSRGERLELKLFLPNDERPISCQCRVAWANLSSPVSPSRNQHPSGMGLEFITLEDEHRLRNFLGC
jgi:two-component system chemotaxis response regulator CheY